VKAKRRRDAKYRRHLANGFQLNLQIG